MCKNGVNFKKVGNLFRYIVYTLKPGGLSTVDQELLLQLRHQIVTLILACRLNTIYCSNQLKIYSFVRKSSRNLKYQYADIASQMQRQRATVPHDQVMHLIKSFQILIILGGFCFSHLNECNHDL